MEADDDSHEQDEGQSDVIDEWNPVPRISLVKFEGEVVRQADESAERQCCQVQA